MNHFRANLLLLVFTLVICCVLYPAVLYAIGHVLYPVTAAGSLVDDAGNDTLARARGSRLIAQPFTGDEYFQPRPSAASYNATASGGSNWGASQPKLRDRVAQQLGPIVVYKAGTANSRTPQEDLEAWFAALPDRAATWANNVSVGPTAWAKTDFAEEKYGLQGEYIMKWANDHPEVIDEWKRANPTKTEEPKPEDLVGVFFTSFAKAHPAKWPAVRTPKQGEKRIEPAAITQMREDEELKANLAAIDALFFDLWLSDPANKSKAADLEPVAADMVMASGSGLDPHITLRNALSVYQLDRVAKKRAASESEVATMRQQIADLLRSRSFTPLSGLVGEPLVNVLEVNIELDARFPMPARSP